MRCKSCGSENLTSFNGEVLIHFRGLGNIDEPPVLVFPALAICRNCGYAEFVVPEKELRLLTKGRLAGGE